MPTTRTTETFEPYLKRQYTAIKIGDAVAIFSSCLFQYFPGADGIEQFLSRKEELQKVFEDLSKKTDQNKMIGHRLRMKRFYHEIFDERVDVKEFETHLCVSKFRYLMYVSSTLTAEKLLSCAQKLLRIEIQTNSNIDFLRRTEYEYVFSYSGYTEHDKEHSLNGESVGDRIRQKLEQRDWVGDFTMNCFEYLLCALFKYWLTGKQYDNQGWTLTSSITGQNEAIIVQSQGVNYYIFRTLDQGVKVFSGSTGMRGIYFWGNYI